MNKILNNLNNDYKQAKKSVTSKKDGSTRNLNLWEIEFTKKFKDT